MQVLARVKSLDESLVARQVRHESHFDLRVVGAHERGVARPGSEGSANAHAVGAARGNVLQIRVRGGQAAGRGGNLREGRVDALVGTDGGN